MNTPTKGGGTLSARARLCLEQSRVDLRDARRLLRRRRFVDSAFHSVQAASNGLSAVCFGNGVVQLPGVSPARLLQVCQEFSPDFLELEEACATLEEASGVDPFRAPPGVAAIDQQQARRLVDHATAVILKVANHLEESPWRNAWSALGKMAAWITRRQT